MLQGANEKRNGCMKCRTAIIDEENSLQQNVIANGHVYAKVGKEMYSLPQEGLIAQEWLENRLS